MSLPYHQFESHQKDILLLGGIATVIFAIVYFAITDFVVFSVLFTGFSAFGVAFGKQCYKYLTRPKYIRTFY